MTSWLVPFNRPTITGDETAALAKALESRHLSGDGPFTHACHRLLEEATGAHKALLTTSGTHALEMAAFLLDLRPGDEVLVPAFTFVSTANAFVLRGASPKFVDIRPDTLNIDPVRAGRAVTRRTRAIVAVHYAGVGCDMDAIGDIAAEHRLRVIEDAAHALFGRHKGRPLGSFGDLAALSFHETKNVTCGEGGALLINDPSLVARAEIVREKGTDRSRFFRGEVDKYGWVDVGSSYLPSELLAAMLHVQLQRAGEIQRRRRDVWHRYANALRDWAEAGGARLPFVPADADHPYHMFYVVMPSSASRDALLRHLRECGILAVFHYLPLNTSVYARAHGLSSADCPVTEDVSARLVRLPFYTNMTDDEQQLVIDAVLEVDPR